MANSTYSVSQFNEYIKNLLQTDPMLSMVTVEGEVSSAKYYSSGHLYIDLKEEVVSNGRPRTEVLKVVMWASNVARMDFKVEPGQRIIARGSVGIFNSGYQVVARNIMLAGTGLLHEKFERLKQDLKERGIFDEMYKKPIPKYCLNIGVATSKSGAVIHDIENVSKRRNPYINIFLKPCVVQGQGAAESIVSAIKYLDTLDLDVIIVGRGGGSIEDLWCFNEESVAMAIFECKTPIISAVGHEVDYTIADFVADHRAPTPSAAAEIAVFEYDAFVNQLQFCADTMKVNMLNKLNDLKGKLSNQIDAMQMAAASKVTLKKQELINYSNQLHAFSPRNKVQAKKIQLNQFDNRVKDLFWIKYNNVLNKHKLLSEKIDALSPLKKMTGGYGYISVGNTAVSSVNDVKKDDKMLVRLHDGTIKTIVQAASKGDSYGK